eukprot:CAMPEP_0206552560 /NCGR_PEP_ID=MMETSP0325_2-20121206/16155_1 /ASSEMBLY_ACC=CAM_ASM_000347 /TAXON_ID=2866 /ORGANISM="Crypthecodinium cohnii, Strain Seligo" /LENGTH=363 /DNA_ID=CAMNT_0054052461 /DNA_START=119 /DNA_END=1210 /DNA_ORIENTATION=+
MTPYHENRVRSHHRKRKASSTSTSASGSGSEMPQHRLRRASSSVFEEDDYHEPTQAAKAFRRFENQMAQQQQNGPSEELIRFLQAAAASDFARAAAGATGPALYGLQAAAMQTVPMSVPGMNAQTIPLPLLQQVPLGMQVPTMAPAAALPATQPCVFPADLPAQPGVNWNPMNGPVIIREGPDSGKVRAPDGQPQLELLHHQAATLCDDKVVTGLAITLEKMSQLGTGPLSNTSFHLGWRPEIRISDYVAWFRKFLGCSVECFVLGMIYMDRTMHRSPALAVTPMSSHRLLACSMTLAAKFQDDAFFKNAHYAAVSGLDLKDLNGLQRNMLELMDYRLVVEPKEFEKYHRWLVEAAIWTTPVW